MNTTALKTDFDYTANTLIGLDKRKFLVNASEIDHDKPLVGTIDYLVRRIQKITKYAWVQEYRHNGTYEIICSDDCADKEECYDFDNTLVITVIEAEVEAA